MRTQISSIPNLHKAPSRNRPFQPSILIIFWAGHSESGTNSTFHLAISSEFFLIRSTSCSIYNIWAFVKAFLYHGLKTLYQQQSLLWSSLQFFATVLLSISYRSWGFSLHRDEAPVCDGFTVADLCSNFSAAADNHDLWSWTSHSVWIMFLVIKVATSLQSAIYVRREVDWSCLSQKFCQGVESGKSGRVDAV